MNLLTLTLMIFFIVTFSLLIEVIYCPKYSAYNHYDYTDYTLKTFILFLLSSIGKYSYGVVIATHTHYTIYTIKNQTYYYSNTKSPGESPTE